MSSGREEDALHCVTEHCLDYWSSLAETHAGTPIAKRREIKMEM